MLGIDWSELAAGLPAPEPLSQHQRHQLLTVKAMAEQRLQEMERTSGMAMRLLVGVPRKELTSFSALDEYHQWYIINDLVRHTAMFWFDVSDLETLIGEKVEA